MKVFSLILCLLFVNCAGSLPFSSNDLDNEIDIIPDETSEVNGETLMIVAINVGQGDAMLIVTPSSQAILIDAGPPESGKISIIPLFLRLGIHHLDYIFSSHYDFDHIGGIPEVIAGFDEKLGTKDDLLPSISHDRGSSPANEGDVFEDYLKAIDDSRQTLLPGNKIDFEDGVTIDCLIVNGETADDQEIILEPDEENEASIGLLIQYGDFRFFTSGDLSGGGFSGNNPKKDLEGIVAPLVGEIDILKVNHHGSETSTSQLFVEELSPTVSLISVGNDNDFGHPKPAVLARLDQIGSAVYQTEQGAGGFLPSAHILNDSIFIFVEEDGSYTVNGDEYKTKE